MNSAQNPATPRTAEEAVTCTACGSTADKIGETPFVFHFLARQFLSPLDTGNLYACQTCGLWFKHPYLSRRFLQDGYRSAPANLAWNNDEQRQDFILARQSLMQCFPAGGKVLDLGCYMGKFLRSLPDSFRKFGIEPCRPAAEAAEDAGIQILDGSPEDLGTARFEAISLFDVFEHLDDPLQTLDTLVRHLRPGGLLIIGTGFADHPVFQRMGAKYHYVCIPEHVSFLTRGFAAFLGRRYGADYRLATLSRNRGPARMYLRALAIDMMNFPTLFLPSKQSIARIYFSSRLRRIAAKGIVPFWPVADHAILLLTKPQSGMIGMPDRQQHGSECSAQ